MPTKSPLPNGYAAQVARPAHKTSARPIGADPHYQNGDSIDLPKIPSETEDEDSTDSEDEDSEDGDSIDLPEIATDSDEVVENLPSWENTPALRLQAKIDPASIFGPPTQINLEEVFRSTEHTGGAQKPWLVRLH